MSTGYHEKQSRGVSTGVGAGGCPHHDSMAFTVVRISKVDAAFALLCRLDQIDDTKYTKINKNFKPRIPSVTFQLSRYLHKQTQAYMLPTPTAPRATK